MQESAEKRCDAGGTAAAAERRETQRRDDADRMSLSGVADYALIMRTFQERQLKDLIWNV